MNDSNNNPSQCDMDHEMESTEIRQGESETQNSEDKKNVVDKDIKPSDDSTATQSLIETHMTTILNRCASNGESPLLVACSTGCVPVVRRIAYSSNIDVNRRDKEGNTALMLAAHGGHIQVLRFLLWNYKDVLIDAMNFTGMTALMKTALCGHTLCARILIVSGADAQKRDHSRNMCAHEWALLCGFKKTAQAIKRVSSAGNLHIERRLLQETPHRKLAIARDIYFTMKRRFVSKFRRNRDNWTEHVGSLYYLVEASMRPENVLFEMACDEREEKIFPEILPERCESENDEDVTISEYDNQSFISPSLMRKNSKIVLQGPPLIVYTNASPSLKRKTRRIRQSINKDENHLQVPKRSHKSNKKS